MRVLARLHERAGEEIEGQLDTAAEERQALWEAMLTVAICGDVLVDLVGTDVEEAILCNRRERAEAASSPRTSGHEPAPNPSAEHRVLGLAVCETRARRSLSQERLGLTSGPNRNCIGATERGEINPTFRILLQLSHGLTVPLSELFTLYEQRRQETG